MYDIRKCFNFIPLHVVFPAPFVEETIFFPSYTFFFLGQKEGVHAAAKSLQPCLTLSDPMECSLPGSSIHGIFRATVLEWGAIAFSGG